MLKKENEDDSDESDDGDFFKEKSGEEREIAEAPLPKGKMQRIQVTYGDDGKAGRSKLVTNSTYLQELRDKAD